MTDASTEPTGEPTTGAAPGPDAGTDRRDAARRGLLLSWWAQRRPEAFAVIGEHGTRTFAELDAHANRLVRALRARGLGAGDGVAVLCANRPELVDVVVAVQRSGMRLTTVNWHLTGSEAGYVVDDCEARALVADARFAETASEAAERAPRVEVRLAVDGPIPGFDDYAETLASASGAPIDDPEPGTTMLYTSGTTGRPKGVRRDVDPAVAATAIARVGDYRAGDHLHLCTGPLYHAAPLAFSLNAPLAGGVGVVLMDGWDAEETLRLVDRHRVTHTHMVPTMFQRLLRLPDDVKARHDPSSLRFVIHGAAPCPVPVKQAMIDWWGPILVEYYAATEGVGSLVSSEEWLRKPGTVGRPVADDQVRILDVDGTPLPAGEVGLVYLKAPERGRFRYFKADAKTEQAYRGDHFTLGDVGYLDHDGYLFLTDRDANVIITGGVNVYPAEVEAVLVTHPAVGDVGVIGVPDDEWGEQVVAVVEVDRSVATEELATELVEWCRERLAHYKCPRRVDFVDRLPRHDTGKLYKQALREQYRARTETGGTE